MTRFSDAERTPLLPSNSPAVSERERFPEIRRPMSSCSVILCILLVPVLGLGLILLAIIRFWPPSYFQTSQLLMWSALLPEDCREKFKGCLKMHLQAMRYESANFYPVITVYSPAINNEALAPCIKAIAGGQAVENDLKSRSMAQGAAKFSVIDYPSKKLSLMVVQGWPKTSSQSLGSKVAFLEIFRELLRGVSVSVSNCMIIVVQCLSRQELYSLHDLLRKLAGGGRFPIIIYHNRQSGFKEQKEEINCLLSPWSTEEFRSSIIQTNSPDELKTHLKILIQQYRDTDSRKKENIITTLLSEVRQTASITAGLAATEVSAAEGHAEMKITHNRPKTL